MVVGYHHFRKPPNSFPALEKMIPGFIFNWLAHFLYPIRPDPWKTMVPCFRPSSITNSTPFRYATPAGIRSEGECCGFRRTKFGVSFVGKDGMKGM